MGLFKKSKTPEPPSFDPIVTYHISQNLSGKLNIVPTPPSHHSYSLTIAKKKAWRDTIEVAIHRSITSTYESQSDVVGHCLIQTVKGNFLETRFDSYGKDVKLERGGGRLDINKSTYTLSIPSIGKYKWTHDHDALTSTSHRLKLVDDVDGRVLARFGGSEKGVSEFGVLEVYDAGMAGNQDWCGLCILTAVCVFAREERSREMRGKANSLVGAVGNWGGLLTMGVPVGN